MIGERCFVEAIKADGFAFDGFNWSYPKYTNPSFGLGARIPLPNVQSFISNLLTLQREELRERIDGLHEELDERKSLSSAAIVGIKNRIIDDILKILNEKV